MSWRRAKRVAELWAWAETPAGAALLLAAPLALVALLTGLKFAPQTDELKFHLGVVQQFGAALPALPWRDYHAATPPLPYLLWALWAQLFGYGLPALRVLTLLLSYAGVLAFYDLARRRGLPGPLWLGLLLLFSPYVFLNSFTLYTVNMGLLCAVLALRGYLAAGWRGLLGGGLAAGAAIYCRQHYLFLPAGVGLVWLAERIAEFAGARRGSASSSNGPCARPDPSDAHKGRCYEERHPSRFWRLELALIALPVALFAPLVIAWGGLTPPGFQTLHTLRVNAENVNFLLLFVGVYGAPLALWAWPSVIGWGRRAVWLCAGAPLYLLFPPSYASGDNAQLGIILHGLDIVGRLAGGVIATAGGLALWANGLVILAAGLRGGGQAQDLPVQAAGPGGGGQAQDLPVQEAGLRAGREVWLYAAWTLAFAAILLASDAVYERFYVLITPVLLLWLYPQTARRRVARGLWLALSVALSMAYFAFKA